MVKVHTATISDFSNTILATSKAHLPQSVKLSAWFETTDDITLPGFIFPKRVRGLQRIAMHHV